MKILITAPNLSEDRNVSGISTIVRQILEHGRGDFQHFEAGSRDGENSGPQWLFRQFMLPPRFLGRLLATKPDVVHINTALTERSIYRDAALSEITRSLRVPLVIAVHGGRYLIEDLRNGLARKATERMLTTADAVVVYSAFEKEQISRYWPQLNYKVLPNAVPGRSISVPSRNNERARMLFFGRMHESKGLDDLVEACKVLKTSGFDYELRAYGEGPIRERFVANMTTVLGTRFRYGGVVVGEEKWQIYDDADIFILPSRYGEGMPMAVIEAMARGCVVIASDNASVSTVVNDGTNGYLVKPNDPEGLASKMKVVLSDRRSWAEVGENAAKTIRDRFEIGSYIDKLDEIYRSVRKPSA